MSQPTTTTATARASLAGRPSPLRAFAAILWRDLWVSGRDLPIVLAQVLLQPLFLLFVFGKILSDIGQASHGYSTLLFPGIIALTTVLTALQGTALPLVLEFSFSREIEDRLLAPLPLMMVAVEKMVFASLRGILAAAVMFPLGYWILGSLHINAAGIPLLALAIVLGSVLGAAIGMTLGTFVPPTRINIMFALVLTPLIFTGCTQYPWPSLSGLRWFQIITLFNPLTYASETIRGAVVPGAQHMSLAIALPMLLVTTALFIVLGMFGFRRRAVD